MVRKAVFLAAGFAVAFVVTAAEPTVISLRDIVCASCGAAVVERLSSEPGVHEAAFDRDRVEVAVEHDDEVLAVAAILEIVAGLGYDGVAGAGQGRYAELLEFPDSFDVSWISRGEDVELEEHLAPNKVTVFDFYAIWCGPCRRVDSEMLAILQQHDAVALRKLDVGDWESPVARHYLARVSGLPYVIVYGKTGKRLKSITGLDIDKLRKTIRKGLDR